MGGKHWWHYSSDQSAPCLKGPRQDKEEAANNDEVHLKNVLAGMHKKGKALKDPRRETFSKESNIMKVARWVYQKAHRDNFEQEGSYDLSSVFHQMATCNQPLECQGLQSAGDLGQLKGPQGH